MSLPLRFRPEAVDEFVEAADWYDEQRPGLGDEFVESVQSKLATIVEWPEGFPKVHNEFRRALVSRFPYAICYQLFDAYILVVAVFHVRRDPDVWKQRGTG